MNKIYIHCIFLLCILSGTFIACVSNEYISDSTIFTYISPNPEKGFNYGYYYYIPPSIEFATRYFLLVEPNNSGGNTGYTLDSVQLHSRMAQRTISGKQRWADTLGVALLVPAIPRPETSPPYTEPQILNRAAMLIRSGKHARVDLQLINMINDFRTMCEDNGIILEHKILINGFSASGNFGNRFTALHPELVHAVVSGGASGLPILPIDSLGGERLIYPVGVADIERFIGKPFDLQEYLAVPQFIYYGSEDNSYPLQSQIFWGDIERNIITKVFGNGKWGRL